MRRFLVIVAVFAAGIGALALWLLLRAAPSPHASIQHGNGMSAALSEWVANAADGSTIDMRSLSPRTWDTFVVFPPYTPRHEIDRALGFHWPEASQSCIHYMDDRTLVVFVERSVVVMAIEHPRSRGDFASGRFVARVPVHDGVVRVMRDPLNGWPSLEPVSAVARPPA